MSMTDQQKHDLLMELRPSGAEHVSAECQFCTVEASEEDIVATEKDQAIFTQEQHNALLVTAVEKATTEATATVDAEVLSLNSKLDVAIKAHEEASTEVESLKQEIADAAEVERLTVLAVERVAAVEAVVTFSEEQIASRKESWANMSEEDFASYLEDIQAVAKASAEPKKEKAPKTSFDGTRATAGADDTEVEALKSLFSGGLSAAVQS